MSLRALLPHRVPSLVFALAALASPAAAQTIRVTAETENLRAEPRGEIIAALPQGTVLENAAREGGWYRATLRGWVWAASVESAGRPDRVTVSAAAGENLRVEPNGDVVARLNPGTVLTELERRDRWVRVERSAFVWGQSVAAVGASQPTAAAQEPPARPQSAPQRAQPSAATPQPAGNASAQAPARPQPRAGNARQVTAGARGTALLQSPDGDTLARVTPMTTMEVVATEGNWARVRMEGWVWQPGLAAAADTGTVLRDVSAAVLTANPDNFRGRTIEWRLQFISLERAERIRTDFYEGEPFILARGPGEENAFVYVAVPPERVAQVERMGPLERVVVLARVRTGRSRVMGAPVLDLIELRRE
ncbi:MAG TPA: hypothetical protein VF039_11780 [Longimicrobiales bacterium]